MGYEIIAAIDFGTTFSGYAYSFTANKDSVYVNKNWGEGQGFRLYKNPTCVLLKPDGQFEAFGFEAVSKHSDLSDDESKNYYFFDRFKMKLFENKTLNTEIRLKAANGKSYLAVEVFAHSLKFMKNHLLKALENHLGYGANPDLIQWVLTVPAIWEDNAKQFMREAALRGGLIDARDSKQLLIVLEPEAASLYCRQLSADKFVGHNSGSVDSRPSFKPDSKHLVVDAGGGTVDCVAHTIGQDLRIKELSRASGGPWGGTLVDTKFADLLHRIFGEGFIKAFKRDYPKDNTELMQEFEIKKRGESDSVRIQLPYNFCTFTHNGMDVQKAVKNFKDQDFAVKFSAGFLVLTSETLTTLFNEAIRKINDHVGKLLRERQTRNLKHIFLVGGFADSSRLQKAIRGHFGGRITCHVPEEASLAVVRGAVAFGHDIGAISQRICRFTYGTNICHEFKEGEHREDLKIMRDGKALCSGVFQTWVEAGDVVSHNHKLKKEYLPTETGLTFMTFIFYRSTRKNIKYFDEPGMEKCGYMEVQMPDLTGEKNRVVDLEVIFGGTEIQVSARDRTSGSECETTIDFLAV